MIAEKRKLFFQSNHQSGAFQTSVLVVVMAQHVLCRIVQGKQLKQ